MKKKWMNFFATLFVCATLALGFVACKDEENNSSSLDGTNIEQNSSDSSSSSSDNNSGDSSSEQTHTHNYTAVTTAPTCTEQGFTTYTCFCGYNYVDDCVNALNHDFTDYISDNNATYTSDGTKTAICNRDGCNEEDTVTETGTKLASGISFKTLSVDGTDVYGKVSNTTETFSFINEVTAVGTAKFVVSLDIYGVQQVATKTIPLTVGDNTVYITEMVDDEPINVYTVKVRRRSMYDVTFNVNGGTSVEKQVIEEDSLATEPTTTRTGYTFNAWDYDFGKPITKATEIKASWTANTNTRYKVEYYLQNLENDEYTLETTENKTGTTDTIASAEIKTFAHFTHAASATDSGNIAPNGSTVLKVYYTRNKYTLSINDSNAGTITNEGTYKYGTEAQVSSATVKLLGYTVGWYHGDTLLSSDLTYTFTVEQDVVAKFTVKAEMSNFDFTPTSTTCKITGVKDRNVAKIVVPDYVTGIDEGAFRDCSSLTEITLPFVGESETAGSYRSVFGYIFGYTTEIKTGSSSSLPSSVPSSISGATYQYAVPKHEYVYYYEYYHYYIPASLREVTINGSIDSDAFYNCSNLTSVTIGDGATYIGYSAFQDCSNLKKIAIPDSITSIAGGAFSGCNSLKYNVKGDLKYLGNATNPYLYLADTSSINIISANIDGNCRLIGSRAFADCSNLTNLVIPDSVTQIGENAFYNCSSLMSVVIPNSVTNIESYAFCNCSSLTNIVIPNSITSIEFGVFINCSSLTGIQIPDSVTTIEPNAFSGCSGLTNIVIPDSVRSIGDYAFSGCDGLTSVTMPTMAIAVIPKTSLQTVILTSGDSIGKSAFYECENLKSITIPDSVESIGDYAFYKCMALIEIKYNATECMDLSSENNVFAYVGQNGNGITVTIGASVKKIPAYLFCPSSTSSYSPNIINVVFERSNASERIGSCAFGYCDSLTNVYITNIEAWCNISFEDSSANPLTFAENLYLNNELVTELVIPNTVKEIKAYAFYNCYNLTSVVFEKNSVCESIGEGAFYGCSNLAEMTLPFVGASRTAMGYKAVLGYIFGYTTAYGGTISGAIGQYHDSSSGKFYYYYIPTELKRVTILSATIVGDDAFSGCDGLTSVVIGEGVKSIGSGAFFYCIGLKSITLPDGVTSIGGGAFQYCSGLTSIVIPVSVTSIGFAAFDRCSCLTRVYYQGTPSDWASISIDSGNTSLTNATLYCYSESEPTTLNADGTAYDGNYWYYDENNQLAVWVYTKPEK